jgi:Hint module
MGDLRLGDTVLTYDLVTGTRFSAVYAFLDYKISETFEFIQLDLDTGHRLVVSPRHRVFIVNGGQLLDVDAQDILVSNLVLTCNDVHECNNATVLSTTVIQASGAFAPVTFVGTVVVDHVVASSYAIAGHAEAHLALFPLRFVNQWLQPTSEVPSQVGMHWYPKFLYGLFGSFF